VSDIAVTMLILAIVVLAFVTNRIPVGLIAVGASLALYATGILDLGQTFAGFGDPAVILIASLFVVAEGLDGSGLTAWTGQQLVKRGGSSQRTMTIIIMIVVAVLAALISVNGAVAALLPVVVVIATKMSMSSARLLLPLAFGAHAGSLLTLTGSPVNVIMSELAEEETGRGFGFFEFSLVGLPIVAGTVLIAVLLGPRLIPARTPSTLATDLGDHARTLLAQFGGAQPFGRVRVLSGSPLIGKTQHDIVFEAATPVSLIAIQSPSSPGPRADDVPIRVGDVLILQGTPTAIRSVSDDVKLEGIGTSTVSSTWSAMDAEYGVAEIVIPPRSRAIGDAVFPGMVTESGDLIIVAIQRGGEDIGDHTDIRLEAGDILLVQGRWEALDTNLRDSSVMVVDAPDQIRRQAAPLGRRAYLALAVLVLMVIALATGIVPPAVAGLVAASVMVLTRVVSIEKAHRSIQWTTVLLVGGMIPVSTAITQTGAADLLATGIVDVVGDFGPAAVLAALGLVTLIFGQLISNTATALIIAPIAISVAYEMGVSPLPFLMAVAVTAAAAVLTPVATPGNLMVMAPGGLQFGDYWKFGLPIAIVFFAVAVLLVPVLFPF
jgi:di/tricarboxylate transporter